MQIHLVLQVTKTHANLFLGILGGNSTKNGRPDKGHTQSADLQQGFRSSNHACVPVKWSEVGGSRGWGPGWVRDKPHETILMARGSTR